MQLLINATNESKANKCDCIERARARMHAHTSLLVCKDA